VGDSIGRDAYYMTQLTQMITSDPYTPEDSLYVNSRAADAGLYGFYSYRRKDCDEEENVRFGIAPGKRIMRRKYRNIADTGLPRRGSVIREDEVLVARTAYGSHSDDIHMPHGECGTVLSVDIFHDHDSGMRRVFVMLYQYHVAGVGYKESNTQGQKGTIGQIRREVDMQQVYGKPEMRIQQVASPIPIAGRVTMASPDELKYARAYGIASITMNATPFARYDPAHLERAFIEQGKLNRSLNCKTPLKLILT
jgi:DNA-directed RNA polymerase beta subunit